MPTDIRTAPGSFTDHLTRYFSAGALLQLRSALRFHRMDEAIADPEPGTELDGEQPGAFLGTVMARAHLDARFDPEIRQLLWDNLGLLVADAYGLYLRDRPPEGGAWGSVALCKRCVAEMDEQLDPYDFYGVPEGTPCMGCASRDENELRQLMAARDTATAEAIEAAVASGGDACPNCTQEADPCSNCDRLAGQPRSCNCGSGHPNPGRADGCQSGSPFCG